MTISPPLHLFEAFGVELEYMIVDAETLDVLPISDRLLHSEDDLPVSEVEHGDMAWSNELTHHVIEIKTNGPHPTLAPLATRFRNQIRQINSQLLSHNALLLPTAMHPWMNPERELHLWPYDYSPVYTAFHRVFNCNGHGWANLQSMHLNFPFADDEEFGKLHAAIRLILPLLPAIAASSPWCDGQKTGYLDSRLNSYVPNSRKVPSVTGDVIPEQAYTQEEYHRKILEPMYREIEPFDPDGLLQHEFLNARGVIARFDRNAIEIRLIDVQESPLSDIAIASLVTATLQRLVNESCTSISQQKEMEVASLRTILDQTIQDGERSVITDRNYLRQFGISEPQVTAQEVWCKLFEDSRKQISASHPDAIPSIELILKEGPLARRMLNALSEAPSIEELRTLFRSLAECLAEGRAFHGL
ncbi:Carboxylate-amine ligase YbdK [Thalassoglobus neptunius]|uniref:Carboxylate-amine ligase YbdK n=1 Tax=Thalassoglobus neptunius TaxID=1938619 RepID=A0A5C5X8S4_9PLAN|nr:glutamate-cysteine ligase family protein [Thalassoglobus neptunius]TWT58272.1 Carboxylate-amine ligase YbdK [Thalassoglobus neptunius]